MREKRESRRGSRIQKGGGFVHSEGGVSYRNFRSGSKLLQGPGQINKQKKIADSRRGGFRSPKKNPCIREWRKRGEGKGDRNGERRGRDTEKGRERQTDRQTDRRLCI